MSHIIGSLITVDNSNSGNPNTVGTDVSSVDERMQSVSGNTPLDSSKPVESQKGWFSWLWGSSTTEDQTADKVTTVSTPQILEQQIISSDEDEDDYTDTDDDDLEFFDARDEWEDHDEVDSQKEEKVPAKQKKSTYTTRGFGPPGIGGLGGVNPYGLSDEEAAQFERDIQESRQHRIDNTEKDSRGWGGWVANLAAKIPGAGVVVRNDWARGQIKSRLLGGTDFSALVEEMRREIRIVTGDIKLAKAVENLSGVLTVKIVGSVLKNYDGFGEFLQLESGLIDEIVKAMLLKAALNIAKNTKLELGADYEGDIATLIFEDIMKLANESLDQVSLEKFEEISQIANVNERKKQLRELFKPVADVFLKIALPNGEADLQLGRLSGSVWNAVANEVIPELFATVYKLTHRPSHHTEEDLKELERPGGAGLKTFAKWISEKAKDIIPKALEKNLTDPKKGQDLPKAALKGLAEWLAKEVEKLPQDFKENGSSISDEMVETLRKISAEVDDNLVKNPKETLWFTRWLQDRILDISTSENPEVQRIWDYAKKNIESIIIHALANFAKKAGDKSDIDRSDVNIIPDIASTGLQIIEEFFTENKKSIDDEFTACEKLPEKERNDRLNALFKPLSDKILEEADLENNPFVSVVKGSAFPAILREYYYDMFIYKKDLSSDSEQLKDRLLDPIAHINQASDEMIAEYASVITNPIEGREILWKNSGVGEVVDELEASCGMLAEDVTRIVKNFAENDKEIIAKKLNESLFKNYPLTEQQQKEFGEGIQQFVASGNESMDKTWEYSETVIKAAIFKVLVAVAKNQEVDGKAGRKENENSALPGNVIHRVLSFLSNKIPSIDAELETLKKDTGMSQDEKELAIRELYQPLAKDFLELAGEDLESVLPVPNMLRGPLVELLETTLLPAIFHDVYTQLNELRYQAPENEAKLDEVFPDGSGKKAVNVIADYIRDFVPYYMETKPEVIAEIAKKASGKYLEALSPEHQKQVGDLITKNVHKLGTESVMAETSKAVAEYSRAMMLKIFGGISQNIQGKESEDKHFLMNTSIGFITLIGKHVKRINQIPPGGRMYPAHIVPPKFMHDGFSDKEHYRTNMLHPALAKDYDKGVTEEEKSQQRLNEFFIPFAKDILEISGMNNPDDFPVPEAIRKEVWELFETKILPEVLMNVFSEIMKPETLNILMLKTFDALNEAVNDLGEIEEVDDGEPEDEQQIKLNEALGTLIKEMVELVPDFWTMTVFNSEKIKNMTAGAIGKIVRRKLDDTTMIEILNTGLAGLTMPVPGADRDMTDAQKSKENKRIEKELKQKMTAYISNQAKEKFKDYIKTKWDNFHESFDRGVEKHLGKPGLAIKHFFDDILHFIFFDVLGPVFDFIVFKVIWFFVDMKIAEKSKEIIKDIHMPIHENLLYNLCGEWTNSMKGQQEVEETKAQLIEAFETKKKEEEEAARLVEELKLQELQKEEDERARIENEKVLKEQQESSGQVIQV
jgi:hypothetical protein